MRKFPVPERDKEIGRRLREFRESTRLTRVAFAQALGIDSNALANYEFGRVALPYYVAKKAGEIFDISHFWLAEGEGPQRPHDHLHPEIAKQLRDRMPFSQAYKAVIKPAIKQRVRFRNAAATGGIEVYALTAAGLPDSELWVWALKTAIDEMMRDMTHDQRRKFYEAVVVQASKVAARLTKK